MNVFLPTKNRACQLQCLLDTLSINAANINWNIHLLCKTTSSEFDDGYYLLENRVKKYKNIKLISHREENFKEQFIKIINLYEYLMLLTDDCIFYRNFILTEKDIMDNFCDNTLCFTFRLGLNTTTQYYVTNEQQQHLSILGYKDLNELIRWNWKIRPKFHNYGYMISWDAYAYKRENLLKWATNLDFYDLLTFEDKLTKYEQPRASEGKKFMLSPKQSCIFSNALNSVKTEPILCGTKFSYSEKELNDLYLNGNIIDIDPFFNLELNSCHEEVPLRFKQL